MRSNNHFRFLYYVLSFLLLYSCKTEYDKHDRTSEKRYGKEIEDVRQWVMEHYPEQFSVFLEIEDTTKFQNYFGSLNGTTDEQKEQLKREFNTAVDIGTPQSFDSLLLKLADFCSQMGIKVIVSKTDEDTIVRKWHAYAVHNGTLAKTDCNQ